MRRITPFLILFATAAILLGCNSLRKIEANEYPIGYTELNNYYATTVDESKPQRLILNTQAEFDAHFGAAAVMGRNGEPTRVDFRRQFVLAVVLPPTNRNTTVVPGEILVTDREIIFNYRVNKQERLSYKIMPFTAVAIDKPATDTQMEIIFNQVN